MRAFIQKLSEGLSHLSKKEQAEILKFINRLDTYVHVPLNEKEIKRVQPFSAKKMVVDYVLYHLKEYDYPIDAKYPFDIISYWYCLALFYHSKQENAEAHIINLATDFLTLNHKDLWMMRRFMHDLQGAQYSFITTKIEAHFLQLQPNLESYKWANEIGLQLPNDHHWFLFFKLSTDGKFRMGNSLSATEKETRLEITVNVYPLRANEDWDIKLKNWNNSISAHWSSKTDKNIRMNNKKDIFLAEKPSLLHFKEILNELELIFKTKFDRTIFLQTFQKGIKNKNAVQKWLVN